MMSHEKTDRLVIFPFSDLSIGGDGYMKFETGSTAYIVENNRIVREVKIVKRNGNF